MSENDAKTITDAMARKNKTFRVIETIVRAGGVNVVFVDLPTTDLGTIAGWAYDAGGVPLFVGREWVNNGFVMHMRLRA
jgi:hypothetical protein